MRLRQFVWLGAVGLILAAGSMSNAADSNDADEQLLRDQHISTDGPGLLEFLRKRTPDRASQQEIAALIGQLGHPSFKVRVRASAELIARGMPAVSYLEQAVRSTDLEVSRRAESCLRLIRDKTRSGLAAAAARLIAAQKPAGAAPVLLAYLPFADSEETTGEVQTALAAVAVQDGKPNKDLLAALTHSAPLARGAAAEALARCTACRAQVRTLLRDPDADVRLQTGMALAAAGEKEAIPILINLLAEVPYAQAWRAEDLLLRLAAEEAPAITLGRDESTRRPCRDAWAAWWREHADGADLSRLEGTGRLLGYTLLVMLDAGQALELDAHDRPRLKIDGLQFPLDAQMLPGDRLLVCEYRGDRVTERNRKGEVVWEKRIDKPIAAQRLSNGHTFIATQAQILEVDRDGKQIFSHSRPEGELFMKAQRLPNGDIACVTSLRRFVRLDSTGKELLSFPVNVFTSGGRIDVVPSGRVLVPEMAHNRVVEYDTKGEIVWTVPFRNPVAAVRLANGHTLITSMHQTRAVEVDRAGKEVWSYDANARVTRAFRR
jgi:hypothetical protein